MADEERKALVAYLREQAGYAEYRCDEDAFCEAADQIEADGQRIAELEATIREITGT